MSNQRSFSTSIKNAAFCRQNGQCALCGADLWQLLITENEMWEAHHIRRWSDGGASSLGNCAILCHDCHRTEAHALGTNTAFELMPTEYAFFEYSHADGKFRELDDAYQYPTRPNKR